VKFEHTRNDACIYCVYATVQYRSWESSSKDSVTATRHDLVDFVADAFSVAPTTDLALLHASASYSYPSPSSSTSTPLSVVSTFFFVANCSTDDLLAYSLGAPLTDGIDPFSTDVAYSSTDKLLSELVLGYWISFITTGCAAVVYFAFDNLYSPSCTVGTINNNNRNNYTRSNVNLHNKSH